MYIKMNNDKSLIITVPTTIYQGETNADLITFLVPSEYEGHNVADCTIEMGYTLPAGEDQSEELVCLPEMYKSYLQYSTPVDTRFTSGDGVITIWLIGYDADKNVIFKTSDVLVSIEPSKTHSGNGSGSGGGAGCSFDTEDVVRVSTTALVGQVIAVKAVDGNGKPTEFEVIDLPNVSATVADEILVFGSDDSVTEE